MMFRETTRPYVLSILKSKGRKLTLWVRFIRSLRLPITTRLKVKREVIIRLVGLTQLVIIFYLRLHLLVRYHLRHLDLLISR